VFIHSHPLAAIQLGLAVTYTVTGAKSMQIIEELFTEREASLTKYIFIFGLCEAFLSQIPDFTHLWWVSIVGAVMSLCYSLLAGFLAIHASRDLDVDPATKYSARDEDDVDGFWRGVFTSLGAITFAYGGHSVLLEIQATLRVPPPPQKSMMRGAATCNMLVVHNFWITACLSLSFFWYEAGKEEWQEQCLTAIGGLPSA
jgi:amino acid permease